APGLLGARARNSSRRLSRDRVPVQRSRAATPRPANALEPTGARGLSAFVVGDGKIRQAPWHGSGSRSRAAAGCALGRSGHTSPHPLATLHSRRDAVILLS